MNKLFTTVYNYKARKGLVFSLPSRTKQEFFDECDINKLVARYNKTGVYYDPLTVAKGTKGAPMFADVSLVPDFSEYQAKVIKAKDLFDDLPSGVRFKFDNNPALFFAFVADPANVDECRKLGLLPSVEPLKAAPTPPPVDSPAEASS